MQEAIVTLAPLEVKPLAVLLAGLSGFVVGGIWYGPMFSKPWMAANGFTPEDLKRDFSPGRAYGTALVCSVVAAYALAAVLGTEVTPMNGAFIGALIGLVWVATSFATSYAFERRSVQLLLINAGYHIIEFAVMGAIIGLMQ
jgi:hypothetical protein